MSSRFSREQRRWLDIAHGKPDFNCHVKLTEFRASSGGAGALNEDSFTVTWREMISRRRKTVFASGVRRVFGWNESDGR